MNDKRNLRHFLLHNVRLILYRKLLRSLAGFACWFWLFALFIFSRLDDPLVCFFFFWFCFFVPLARFVSLIRSSHLMHYLSTW